MVKKKKGSSAPKRDARGYGQQAQPQQQPKQPFSSRPSSSSGGTSTLRVTTATQTRLDQVLISMEGEEGSPNESLAALPTTGPSSASAAAGGGGGNDMNTDAAVVGPSDRFVKRLSNVYDRLRDAGFRDEQIGRAAAALGYSITLETALDYLCFHLATAELPPLFTEGSVRDDLAATSTSASLEVIAPAPLPSSIVPAPSPSDLNSHSNETRNHHESPSYGQPEEEHVEEDEEETALVRSESGETLDATTPTVADANKEWILRQYRDYSCDDDRSVDEENDNDDDNVHPEEHERGGDGRGGAADDDDVDSSSEADPGFASGAPDRADDDNDNTDEVGAGGDLSPPEPQDETSALEADPEEEEEKVDPVLNSVRAELEQVRADVHDEASNYLRSKHEIRDLKKKLQQMQKRVADMELRAEKRQRARQSRRAQPMEDNDGIHAMDRTSSPPEGQDDNEEDGGGMLGMFDDEAELTTEVPTVSPKAVTASEPSVQPPSFDFPLDALKVWTGKTPRQMLHEYCSSKKNGWSQPKYALKGNKCTVTVRPAKGDRPPLAEELVGAFRTSHDSVMAKEYVATKALYRVQSDRPLYRVLPPYFADLWKEWQRAETTMERHAKNQVKDERSRNIQRLLNVIASTANSSSATRLEDFTVDASSARDSVVDHHVVRRNDGVKRGAVAESTDDTRLQRMFTERRKTPKYQKMLRERSALPIFAFRDRILECVRAHPVTVLSAETGAGKSTNCGQVRESWSLLPMHAVQSSVPTYVCVK